MYFPWPPPETALQISKFRHLHVLSRCVFTNRWPPKEITKNQALVSKIYNVYLESDAVIFVD
jgi:hypothetical protein